MSTSSILIVEDEAIVAADLASKLRQFGYRVAGSVGSGEEAIDLARQHRPDLVLIDICLAGDIDGIAAAETIRRECDLPVVFLTAHSDAATLERAKLADPFGYVLKPFDERELRTTIGFALFKHQAERKDRGQREWLRVTLNSIGDGVITCDAESRITFLNPVAEKISGWTMAEVLGQPIQTVLRLINEQTRQPCEDPVARVLREGRPLALASHTALIAKDGHAVPIEDSAAPILDAASRVIGAVLVFHDVTEKRWAELALRASEEWNRKLTRLLPVAVYTCDAEGRITFFNEHCRELSGRDPVASKDRWSFAPRLFLPDGTHLPHDQCPMAMALRTGVAVKGVEIAIERPDGTRRTAMAHIDPIRDETGTVVGAINVLVDITERRQLEEQMRVQSAALEAAANAVAMISPRGEIEWVNTAFAQLTGYSADEALGQNPRLLKSGQHPPEFYRAMWDTVLAGRVWRGEVINKRKDGTLFTEDMTITPVTGADGAITRFIAIKQDVTEQKQTEAALRGSEERYRALTALAPDAVFLHDADGRLLDANLNACRMLGYSREQLLQMRVTDIETDFDSGRIQAVMARVLAGGTQSIEGHHRRRDGTSFPVEARIAALELNGQQVFFACVRDITERRQTEASVRHLAQFPEQNPNPVLRVAGDGRLLYANVAGHECLAAMAGATNEELPTAVRSLVAEAFQQTLTVEAEAPDEYGRTFLFSAVRPVGEHYVNLYGRDVTVRKRTEAKLRASLDRYQSFLEVTGQVGWTTNADGEVVDDMPAWGKFTGQTFEEMRGWGWSKAVHPDDLERTAKVWREAVAGKTIYEVEYRLRRHDGVYRHFLARGVPTLREDGSVREWVGTCIDITEIKRAEQALRESREDLNRAQAVANVGSWRFNVQRNELIWSDECWRIFGVPAGTPLTFETFLGTVHPEDRDYVVQQWTAALRGAPYDIEHRIVVGETVKWVRERAVPELDSAGVVIGGFGTTQDVTERKLAAEALRESEERLQQAMRLGRCFAFEWSPLTDKIIRATECEPILGLTTEAAVSDTGRAHFRRVHPQDRKPLAATVSRLAPDADTYTFKYRMLRPDGQTVVLEETARASFDNRGRTKRLVGITVDVTERERMVRELAEARDDLELRVKERTAELNQAVTLLRESEERYRTLFEAAPLGIALTDHTGRVLDANPSLCALFGVTLAEAKASQARDFYAKVSDRKKLMASVRRFGQVDGFETTMHTKSGAPFAALVQMSRVELHGRKVLLGIVQNITQRKQAEKRIQGVNTLLELYATKPGRQDYLHSVVELLRSWCDCQAVGLRLVDAGGCLPFAASAGFTRRFLKQESLLGPGSEECPCLRVVQGRVSPGDKHFVNASGSLLCNHVSDYLARFRRPPTVAMPCVEAGFESIAQIPIRFQGRVMGSIHMADQRSGRFGAEVAEFIESVAPLVGEALHRFQVEESLRESEQRFRSMFESHAAVMLLIDPETGAIVDANPPAARHYGYSRSHLCSMTIEDLNLQAPAMPAAGSRVGGGRAGSLIMRHRRGDGAIRTVEVHSSPVQVAGRHLLFSIAHDITERKHLEKRILEIGDEERQRIGQDLHDSLGGHLTGLALMGKALARALAKKNVEESAFAEEIAQGVNAAVTQTRAIARGLCPVGLGKLGLASSLEEYAGNLSRLLRVDCRVETRGRVVIRDEAVAAHLFRIVQEAVSNATRHGKARRIRIQLRQLKGALSLEVQDNGRGLPGKEEKGRGMGLPTMRYRAEVIGAEFEITSKRGKGTLISCRVPLQSLK